jgi:sec-independent protein translocase protein TatA
LFQIRAENIVIFAQIHQLNPKRIIFMFNSLGAPEILIIAIVVLVLFGAKRIPELARGLGQGIKEFRQASKDIKKEIEDSSKDINDAANHEETTSKSN